MSNKLDLRKIDDLIIWLYWPSEPLRFYLTSESRVTSYLRSSFNRNVVRSIMSQEK